MNRKCKHPSHTRRDPTYENEPESRDEGLVLGLNPVIRKILQERLTAVQKDIAERKKTIELNQDNLDHQRANLVQVEFEAAAIAAAIDEAEIKIGGTD